MRRAISTPRVGIPASTTFSSCGLRSIISCAIRRSARRIASASMIGTAVDEFCFVCFMRFLGDLAGSLSRIRLWISRSFYSGFGFAHPLFPPIGAMLHNPIEQCLFEADVLADFFALDPLMFQDFRALCEEFLVKNRILNELRLVLF